MTAVLIVEDEQHLASGLRFNLEAEGYRVEVVGDGEAALRELLPGTGKLYNAVVLDVMLPGSKDGFTVASELRQAGQFIPVLMLTARGRPEDVLRGFEAGADDYLAKPFELQILLARLRSLLRRREWLHRDQAGLATTSPRSNDPLVHESETSGERRGAATDSAPEVFVFDKKVIDFNSLELRIADRVVRLTLMEAELLRYLVRHVGKPVSRKAMLGDVWGLREDTDTRAIDNFIVRLRKYIEEDPSMPRHLLTVRGVGYRFVAKAEPR